MQRVPRHSISSSTRTRIDGLTVMPSAFAVFTLTTSSNLVGCSTGSSAGLAPFRNLVYENCSPSVHFVF